MSVGWDPVVAADLRALGLTTLPLYLGSARQELGRLAVRRARADAAWLDQIRLFLSGEVGGNLVLRFVERSLLGEERFAALQSYRALTVGGEAQFCAHLAADALREAP